MLRDFEVYTSKLPILHILEGRSYAIGRARENDIVLPTPDISRYHAEICSDGLVTWLRDVGSRNGTMLNGRCFKGEVEVSSGDEITLGNHFVFQIQLCDEPEETNPVIH